MNRFFSVTGMDLDAPDSGIELGRPRNLTTKLLQTPQPKIQVGTPLAKMATAQPMMGTKHVQIRTFQEENMAMLNQANEWANKTQVITPGPAELLSSSHLASYHPTPKSGARGTSQVN